MLYKIVLVKEGLQRGSSFTDLALLEVCLVVQCHSCRSINTGQSGTLLKGKSIVNLDAKHLRQSNLSGKASARHVDHAIANGNL